MTSLGGYVTKVTVSRYLGVDVGGQDNTWMASIVELGGRSSVEVSKTTLKNAIFACQKEDALALAIDAQLTFSISRENGFRPSDEKLRDLLHADFRHRVASCNSLMAVPLRGTALAVAASPFIGTVIETHPTACLLLALDKDKEEIREAVRGYKTKKGDSAERRVQCRTYCQLLWERWTKEFGLPTNPPKDPCDGQLDAVVTATVAWLYHKSPERLRKLAPGENDEVGRGPFWVARPPPNRESIVTIKLN